MQEMDAGNITLLLLLDLSAAFDCVDHQMLLNRLQITNLLESVIAVFASFLSKEHEMYTVMDSFPVRIMQFGSILGPLMFRL